jgi:lipopolysaccharide transport system ATP-binding protein
MEKGEVLIKAQGVSKKFCRNLKRSLWYGVTDIGRSMVGMNGNRTLRKDEFWAVRDVSFEVRRGECLGLIGHNGAGKSTLLKMLNGLIRPDEGRIEMHGRIGALIELGAGFNPVLTGRENVYNNGAVLGFTKEEIDRKFDDIVAFAELKEFIDMPVQNYSSGMKVRLGFAVASQMEPDILIIDEVLAVGDAAFRVKCFNIIDQLINSTAVIFVSHSMPQITRICNNLLLLEKGVVLDYSDNLSRIISEYHQIISKEYSSDEQGSGKVAIEDFQILDKNNSIIKRIKYAEPFKIRVNVNFKNESNLNYKPKLLVTVADGEGVNVAQILEDVPVIGTELYQAVEYSFDRLLFNSGKYVFTASILLGNRGELASVRRNIYTLIAEHSISAYAPLLLTPTNFYNRNE